MHILVIEDDQLVSDFVSEGFSAEGHAVSVADTGENAMELLDLYKFDLIVLDLVLPGIGGLDICKTVRRRGDQIPIVVLSTAGAVETKLELFRLGADDYLSKPFNFEELQMRVDALLRRVQTVHCAQIDRGGSIRCHWSAQAQSAFRRNQVSGTEN